MEHDSIAYLSLVFEHIADLIRRDLAGNENQPAAATEPGKTEPGPGKPPRA